MGYGEAAPSPRVTGETPQRAEQELTRWAARPAEAETLVADAPFVPGGSPAPAARAALVAAALDAEARQAGIPLRRALNLPEGRLPSSVTIGLGPPEAALREAAEWDAAGWNVFKVKLGGPDDEAVVRALRDAYPEKKIRVDANEGWSPQAAESRFRFLERHDIEFVEQPLPRNLVEESAGLARRFDLPILLDEPLLDSEDAVELVRREAGDGGNIKLAKCGGPFEARRLVKVLRDAGWKVMIGCNLETSLGLATAAAFAGVVDYADLDGNVTLAHDLFRGFSIPQGMVATPEGPGIGVELDPTMAGLQTLHPLKSA